LRIFKTLILFLCLFVSVTASEINMVFGDGANDWQKKIKDFVKNHDDTSIIDSLELFLINNGFLDNSVTLIPEETGSLLSIEFGQQ